MSFIVLKCSVFLDTFSMNYTLALDLFSWPLNFWGPGAVVRFGNSVVAMLDVTTLIDIAF